LKATAIVPVKRFHEAKQRLAPGVDDARRAALAAAMLEDVLEAIARTRAIERTIVVSGDPVAQEIATAASAEIVPDPADEGHVEAALAGIARAEADGAGCVVLLPGDCPLLEPRELERLLTGLPEAYVAIVPDRHGEGTNALALSPPSAIRPAFGEGSRARHVDAARPGRADPRGGGSRGRREPDCQGAGAVSAEGASVHRWFFAQRPMREHGI
jgi:2-phospho-L-lactate guanylyltransferase